MSKIRNILLSIIDFDNKTGYIQAIITLGLIALLGLNFGFNEKLLLFIDNILSNIFSKNDLRIFALKYFIVIALLSLFLVKLIISIIAITRHIYKKK